MQLLTSAWSEVSEATITNFLRKVGISTEEAINDQDDPLKDFAAKELEETINEFRERFPDEVPKELNAAFLLDIDAEQPTNGDKPSDVEILPEVQGEAIQEEEDDIDVVYDEPPAPPSAFFIFLENKQRISSVCCTKVSFRVEKIFDYMEHLNFLSRIEISSRVS